mmetsp:Transcript_947/g.3108  ORF Transcript_947/g.3108 Transcript_947/m.3108 type:complete len:213 (-) Transcript_947:130-768(-)
MIAFTVALANKRVRLVEGQPELYAVTQGLEDDPRVLLKGIRNAAIQPAALVLEGLWQVPVIQRDEGLNVHELEEVHELLVEGKPLRVHSADALGEDPRPCDGEAVVRQTQGLRERDIFLPVVVVVISNVPRVSMRRLARGVREHIPNCHSPATLVNTPLNLISSCGRSPGEVRWNSTDSRGVALHRPVPRKGRLAPAIAPDLTARTVTAVQG